MIKNKKDTSKGGRIYNFDFSGNPPTNFNKIHKNYIYFEMSISGKPQKFKISQHTFAHFDEFTNKALNGEIKNFTHIMQYFVVFIFLLNSMELTENDFQSRINCTTPNLKDNTCKIEKKKLTIFIHDPTKINKSDEIYITSLFEKNTAKDIKIDNIYNIELRNTKTNTINFRKDTIDKLLNNEKIITNKNYDISFILHLLKDEYTDDYKTESASPYQAPKTNKQNKKLSPHVTQPSVTIYNLSIPKLTGGKKHKTKSSKKRKNKGRGRKTRKSN